MAGRGGDERNLDPGSRVILGELRDLRAEMRTDRQRSDAERRQADAAWRAEREQSSARFEQMMREFRQDSLRREVATQRAFKDIRTVGLSIVKTLNHHTRILERIERKLGGRGNGRPGQQNGGGASPGR